MGGASLQCVVRAVGLVVSVVARGQEVFVGLVLED